jgi:GntR family transcriptional regulator
MLETLRIENSGVPIYVQIRDQMLRAIGAGILRPGEQMPTMRQVAVALKVDLNTVRHAYDELEKTGAINLIKARGTFVAERPPPLDRDAHAAEAEGLAHMMIATATAKGVDPTEVARLIIEMAQGQNDKGRHR